MNEAKQVSLTAKDIARFWSRVPRLDSSKCWNWAGCLDSNGYGVMSIKNQAKRAHRVSFMIHYGSTRGGMHVLHRCDNPACVNPSHLFEGTNTDNVADMVDKERNPRGETCGLSRFSESQILEIRSKYVKNVYGMKRLAREFGTCQSTINKILKRRTWKHVPC